MQIHAPLKVLCHGYLVHFVNIASHVVPIRFWALHWQRNKEIKTSFQTDVSPKHIKSYEQKQWTQVN